LRGVEVFGIGGTRVAPVGCVGGKVLGTVSVFLGTWAAPEMGRIGWDEG